MEKKSVKVLFKFLKNQNSSIKPTMSIFSFMKAEWNKNIFMHKTFKRIYKPVHFFSERRRLYRGQEWRKAVTCEHVKACSHPGDGQLVRSGFLGQDHTHSPPCSSGPTRNHPLGQPWSQASRTSAQVSNRKSPVLITGLKD